MENNKTEQPNPTEIKLYWRKIWKERKDNNRTAE